jgi:hypothetical protein
LKRRVKDLFFNLGLREHAMTQESTQSSAQCSAQSRTQDSEQMNQDESQTTGQIANSTHAKGVASASTKKSLVAFLRSIKFTSQRKTRDSVGQAFAQLHPRTRKLEKDSRWVPSAN